MALPAGKEEASPISWMDRFGFLQTVKIVHTPQDYRPDRYHLQPDPGCLPLTRLANRDDIFTIVKEVERLLSNRPAPHPTAEEFHRIITIVSELCHNIYRHREPEMPANGYAAMQVDEKGLKFMAMNLGPGIAANLRSIYPLTSDWKIICKACDAGVTSQQGGLGLNRVVQCVRRAQGHMYIRSGDAGAVLGPRGKWERASSSGVDYLWGTQIGIELPWEKRR